MAGAKGSARRRSRALPLSRQAWTLPRFFATSNLMARIVTTTYRYKRPPRKRKAVALVVFESTPMMETGGDIKR